MGPCNITNLDERYTCPETARPAGSLLNVSQPLAIGATRTCAVRDLRCSGFALRPPIELNDLVAAGLIILDRLRLHAPNRPCTTQRTLDGIVLHKHAVERSPELGLNCLHRLIVRKWRRHIDRMLSGRDGKAVSPICGVRRAGVEACGQEGRP